MPPPALQVDFWDVGYGDATVIWLDTSRVILIDSGPENSPVPLWLEKHGIRVDLAIFTHNDGDHLGGFMKLVELRGRQVGPYALLEDRPPDGLQRAWKELMIRRERGELSDPIRIDPRRGEPQDLLAAAGLPPHPYRGIIELKAIYPAMFDQINAPRRRPNDHSAIIVLWFHEQPRVAWPGDLPLGTCQRELENNSIRPTFLVGPHHGGPTDVPALRPQDVQCLIQRIGHTQSWISVAWHGGRKHPLPGYLQPVCQMGVEVRCSQLTVRCDDEPDRFGRGLYPSHDWLGLERPPRGTSCMGPMRVKFLPTTHQIQFLDEHKAARKKVTRPLCNAP